MTRRNTIAVPSPILSKKELNYLDSLTEKYNKLVEPGTVAKIGMRAGKLVPQEVRDFGKNVTNTVTKQKIFQEALKIVVSGFSSVEEMAAKFSISEERVIKLIREGTKDNSIHEMDDICFVRSYQIAKIVNKQKDGNKLTALIEGGLTGAAGFAGLPFNLVLSTFLYFRAVQSIAMFYGYDIKNDSAEMVIASQVFASAISPVQNDINNEISSVIGKVMLITNATVVKQTANKTWSDMASRRGVTLLITQMRALANNQALKALEKTGQEGLEHSLFKEVFEQMGKRITLKGVQKFVPVISGLIGAFIDTAQMKQILEYADIFYHKRFILEKENRINLILEERGYKVIDIVDKQ